MVKNGCVTPREFQSTVERIDKRIDKLDEKMDSLSTDFVALKTKFNDELSDAVAKGKWKYGIGMVCLGGVISLIVSLVV